MEYKNSNKDAEAEAVYTVKYRAKIRQLHREDPDVLLELLYAERIAFMCYCPAGKFCHRHLLIQTFEALGERYGVEIVLMGEIT